MGQGKRFYLSIILLGIVAIFALHDFASAQPMLREGPSEFKPAFASGEILVKFKKWVDEDSARGMIGERGLSIRSTSQFSRVKRLRVPVGEEERWTRLIREDPMVEYAEPNYIAWAFFTPNDPIYPYQWHLYNSVFGGINMESAWDISTGSAVKVAVLDTGVAYEDYTDSRSYSQAPDLADTSFVPGYDFVNNDTHPNDDHSHGTHVTGTIAQSTHNGLGVAGVAYKASIMPVKVLDRNGSGTHADIADGIRFATDNGALVINMSLGGPSPSTTLEEALAYAYDKGVTIVAAAGNNGNDQLMYPAAYNAYVIAVGATRYDENLAYYSSYGSYIDLVAPGGDLTVDQNGDGYGDGVLQQTFNPNTKNTLDIGYWFFHGTSMAAPHVAGVAALVIAKGIIGPDQVRAALETTAEDLGTQDWDEKFGWGIVDAYAALSYSPTPAHDVAVTGIDAPPSVLQGDSVSVNVTVANLGNFDETFDVTLTDTTDGEEIGFDTVTLSDGETSTLGFTWYTTNSSLGDHTLKAEAVPVPEETNVDNNMNTLTVSVNEPSHDVAITGIDAPSSATIGTNVEVIVSMANEGTYSESTTVSLTDTTAGVLIGSQPVVDLSPGEMRGLTFYWDTEGYEVGDYELTAVVSSVPGETDTTDNSMPTIVSLMQGSIISVQDITMELRGRRSRKGAYAYVTVVDGSGTPVSGAEVTGEWTFNGESLNTSIGNSNGEGIARLRSNRVRTTSDNTFKLCVTNIVMEGYTYTLSGNDCATIIVP